MNNWITPLLTKKIVNLFGTVARVTSKSTFKIKLSIPVNDSGAGGFDYTLQVANKFDNTLITSGLCNFPPNNRVQLTKTMFCIQQLWNLLESYNEQENWY